LIGWTGYALAEVQRDVVVDAQAKRADPRWVNVSNVRIVIQRGWASLVDIRYAGVF